MAKISKSAAELDTILTNMDGTTETNFRIKDGVLQVKDTTTTLYHTLWIDAGVLKWATTGEA